MYAECDEELEENTTGEEKCLYDPIAAGIVGSIIFWKQVVSKTGIHNERCLTEKMQHSEIFETEIPHEEYLIRMNETEWLENTRFIVYCLIRAVNFQPKSSSSGLQLSPSCVGTARHSAEMPGAFFPDPADSVFLGIRVKLAGKTNPKLLPHRINTSLHACLLDRDRESIPPHDSQDKVDTPFGFTILALSGGSFSDLGVAFPIPSVVEIKEGDAVVVIEYPQKTSQRKLDLSYGDTELAPSLDDVAGFFQSGTKTASLGRVRFFDQNFLLITAATSTGMSGSPVFNLSGDLLGFLLGSKPNISHNIVIRVSHPTVVIEYCMYAGLELMTLNPEEYGPKLARFVSLHLNLLKQAADRPEGTKYKPKISKFLSLMEKYLK